MRPIEEQPGRREPAPGALEVVQAFINTNDIEGRRDKAGTPELMRRWLVEQRLLDRRDVVDAARFIRLVELREALRQLALANNDESPDPEAVETVNEAAARTLALDFATGGATVRPTGEGADLAIGQLLAIVLEGMRSGHWTRMKACRRDVCRWVFYDHSRNRSSSWCAMAICGNRQKTRAYRRRQADQP